jgi:hypothetical protein
MFLYHLSLQRPTGITQAVVGSFSASKVQELVCARGDFLELLRPDENGKVQTVLRRVPALRAAPQRRRRRLPGLRPGQEP